MFVYAYKMYSNTYKCTLSANIFTYLLQTHSQNGLPEYLCYQCVAYVKKFIRFRDKCQRTYYALRQILERDKKVRSCFN